MERPIYIENGGRRMFAMLHEPEAHRRGVGIVFLNPGPQNRVGPQRIYVKTARRFCKQGLTCLRVDLPGVGESEGEFPPPRLDCYDPADVPGAVDLLLQEHGVERVVLLGMCAGARVAIRAATRDERVDSVIAWSTPVVSGPPDMPLATAGAMSDAAAKRFLRHWAPMLLQPSRWKKYLTSGEARREGWTKLSRVASTLLGKGGGSSSGPQDFLRALDTLVASRRSALFAYGDRDIAPVAEFEERYRAVIRGEHAEQRYVLVPDGDHTFTSLASEAHVIGKTLEWLDERYPASEPGRCVGSS